MLSVDAVSSKCSLCVYRNLSSVNERTRQRMRDMQGLVDSLVSYIEQEERPDDKVMSTIMVLWFSGGVCVYV